MSVSLNHEVFSNEPFHYLTLKYPQRHLQYSALNDNNVSYIVSEYVNIVHL